MPTPFISDDVCWAPARLHTGLSFQPGWIVVRPEWAAFLPTGTPKHLVGEMVWAVAGFVTLRLGDDAYDFAALHGRGLQVFEQTVLESASRGGRVFRTGEADVVPQRRGVMFRLDDKNFMMSDVRPPDVLLAGWRVGKVPFNARDLAKVFAAVTAVPAALAIVCGLVASFGDDPSVFWGVLFWGVLVLLGWGGYGVVWWRATRA